MLQYIGAAIVCVVVHTADEVGSVFFVLAQVQRGVFDVLARQDSFGDLGGDVTTDQLTGALKLRLTFARQLDGRDEQKGRDHELPAGAPGHRSIRRSRGA